MGSCCGGSIKYEHNGKMQTIGKKQAITIDRFSQGASARIQTNKIKLGLAKEIIGKFSCIFLNFL